MEKWRSNESSNTLNLAAPVPHHMLYRRRVGRERARKSYLARPSVVAFQSRPTRHLPTEPATKLEVRSFRGDQRGEGENRSDRVDLGRDSPSCFPPSKKQQMQNARMKYKILEAFIQNHVIAESSTIAMDAGARERGADERRARSFGDRPPGVGNSYCDTTGGRPGGPRDSRNSQPESPGPE